MSFNQLSAAAIVEHGDYSVGLTIAEGNEFIIQNHLLTLGKNLYKTIFFYLTEQDVDQVVAVIKSLVVENSLSESIYDHQVSIVNLVDSDDYNQIKFYFVKHDQLIATTSDKVTVNFATNQAVVLVNNTYTVYAVAKINDNDIILASQTLTLDERSKAMFLIINQDEAVEMRFLEQN